MTNTRVHTTRSRITAFLRALIMTVPLIAVFALAPLAHADTEVLACPAFAATATFNSGLGLTTAGQTIGGSLNLGTKTISLLPCTSPTGVPFVGATGAISGSGNLACVATPIGMNGGGNGTLQMTWYDGNDHVAGHSVATWSILATGGLVPTVSVTITSGDLAGSIVVVQPIITGFSGLCGVLGILLTSVSVAGTSQVLQL